MGSPPVIVTAGADGRLLGFDPRAAFQPLFEFGDITAAACQQRVGLKEERTKALFACILHVLNPSSVCHVFGLCPEVSLTK